MDKKEREEKLRGVMRKDTPDRTAQDDKIFWECFDSILDDLRKEAETEKKGTP